MDSSISENQGSILNSSEQLRLTRRQHRILQVVNQGKSLNELAHEFGISRDAAELLEDIAVRLNHRLNLNNQSEPQDYQQPKQLQTKKVHNSIDNELLTPRQCEILRLVANGLTTKEIAKSLFISVKTVETHRGQVMQRLNIHDLAGLIRYALRVGLISLDE
jgi:DNA-binding NarL/FixJ family response regulator